ncbi:MAG: tungsten-containing formylmethanofuran dehydrogenase 2 subunit B, partial [Candidatus Hecatellales archaeon B24]
GDISLSLPLRQISSLTRDLKNSRFVAIFYGLGLLGTGMAEANLRALHELAESLRKAGTKCVAIPMPGHYNSLGFIETALKEGGYPYALDFSHGNVRHEPGETSAVPSIMRGEVDSALIVGSNPLSSLPSEAARRLPRLPLAVLDYVESLTSIHAVFRVPVAVSGFESGGKVYRLDRVQLELKPVVSPPEGILPDEEFLRKVYEKL